MTTQNSVSQNRPSEKYVLVYAVSTWLGSFCMNYSINAEWHRVDQPVALLRCYGSLGCFDNGLQLVCIVGSCVTHHPLDITPYIFYGAQGLNQVLVLLLVWALGRCKVLL